MNWLRIIFLSIAAALAYPSLSAAETADQVLRRCASSINGTGSVSATFTISYGNEKLTGSIQSSGKMFALQTSASSTWYDGKNMWTYNAKSRETTIMNPTPEEVAEANPLSLVNSYSSMFTAAYAKNQTKGSKTIMLTPKSRHSGYKYVKVVIRDGSNYPAKLEVVPSSGQTVTVSVANVKTSQKLPATTFVYPKSKYPKVEIIDLR